MADQQQVADLARMRISYAGTGLEESDLAADWVTQFDRWLTQAVAAGLTEPNAMVVATATPAGVPSSRTVLAKAVDSTGVTFYTNFGSAKSAELQRNPWASATFPWIDVQRQVHFRGPVVQVAPAVTAAYWATRPRGSQLGGWASPQSTVLATFPAGGPPPEPAPRKQLEAFEARMEQRFGGGPDAVGAPPIPVPPNWGGWRIVPDTVEFWQGRPDRLHDRLQFRRTSDSSWVVERLAP